MAANKTDQDTYQLIVKKAQQLFMELGYRAVSTRQIADQCGITQPALYHHFKNKQTLYAAVIEYTLSQVENDLNKVLNHFPSFRERFYQITLYMLENFAMDLSQMFHDIFHEMEQAEQQEMHKQWVKGFLMPVVSMIENGITEGELRDPAEIGTDPTELAYMILNLIRSSLDPPKRRPLSKIDNENKVKLLVEIFLNGIGK